MKYQSIKEDKDLAVKIATKGINISEVARMAKVSRTTIYNAFHHNIALREPVYLRIKKAVNELYRKKSK